MITYLGRYLGNVLVPHHSSHSFPLFEEKGILSESSRRNDGPDQKIANRSRRVSLNCPDFYCSQTYVYSIAVEWEPTAILLQIVYDSSDVGGV